MMKPAAFLREAIALFSAYAIALIIGGLMFVGLVHMWPFTAIGILFYRGMAALLALAPLLYIVLLGLRIPALLRMNAREMAGCAITASALLCGAFILGPVTVDRSLSVFVLSRFYIAPEGLTKAQLKDAFTNTYIGDWNQIERRIEEQKISGNIHETASGWELTTQGRDFMRTAQFMSRLFNGDPRFVGRDTAAK